MQQSIVVTLHLMYRGGGFAVHASDRLVTYASPGGEVQGSHDLFGNKTLILLAHQGVASLGFTGVAYVGDTPTDEWIARVLFREPLPPGLTMLGTANPSKPPLDLGSFARLLREKLAAAFAQLPRRQRGLLIIPVVGVQWPPRGAPLSSFDWVIQNSQNALDEFSIDWNPSEQPTTQTPAIPGPQSVLLRAVPNYPSIQGREVLDELNHAQTPEAANSVLAKTIQRVSLAEPGVGSDALIVAITPGAETHVTTWFKAGYGQVTSILESGGDAFPLAFSPWVVGREVFQHPGVMAGGGSGLGGDGYTLKFESVPSKYGFGFAQDRKRDRSGGTPAGPFVDGLNEKLKLLAPKDPEEPT